MMINFFKKIQPLLLMIGAWIFVACAIRFFINQDAFTPLLKAPFYFQIYFFVTLFLLSLKNERIQIFIGLTSFALVMIIHYWDFIKNVIFS